MKKAILLILTFVITVLVTVLITGCASLEQKAVSSNATADGFKIETTGSMTTGTLMPNVWFGEIISQFATVPVIPVTDKEGKLNVSQPFYQKTIRYSFFGSIFGLDNKTEVITYIGAVGESAEDTVKRVNALNNISTPAKTTTDGK